MSSSTSNLLSTSTVSLIVMDRLYQLSVNTVPPRYTPTRTYLRVRSGASQITHSS